MSPDNVVAALGILCGNGRIAVRHGEKWSDIGASPGGWDNEDQYVNLADLFLVLTADEAK